ncbi:Rrf2 family transcriptional regulator [Clostridium sp. OS1-26]|uniref:RrF2 family transcriptional regulator n=1 Tax=Clostridium sp. OS1-26 TaxID=3070681 RepID=UPI0027DF45C1|nr:Rrf2 family transcriptional regulator [Clostridium sp. OS1-26]WML36767.1 Rrf2 family transcriptional regulator [Clostridium sp. OS1-26]
MKLSRKTEYACLALIDLARNYKQDPVKIMDISVRNNIPKKYLEQILLILKGSGYVKSLRGADGGYKLAKHPSQITMAEIIRLIDGLLAPVESVSTYFYEHTPIEQNEKLIEVFKDIRDYISRKLESINFDELK